MNHHVDQGIKFLEVQQFRQAWLWVLLLPSTAAVFVLFGYGMIRQLVFHQPWGDRPLSDTALAITGTIMIVSMIGLTYFFFVLKLITETRKDGLHIRFFPLSSRHISFDEIATCEVRTYRPIREFGGWGIKYGRGGKAYNVSGNRGVQLKFKTGKTLLIGSQRPEVLYGAIRTGMGK